MKSLPIRLTIALVLGLVFASMVPAHAADGPVGPPFVNAYGVTVTPRTVWGTITSATTTTVYPAVPGKSICVWYAKLVGNGTVKATMGSGTIPMDSPYPLVANIGTVQIKDAKTSATPLYRTWPGQALVVITDTAGELDYRFEVTEE